MQNNVLLEELEKYDREGARKLNEILSIIARHKSIYGKSKDPAISQIWLAILEIYSRQEKLQKQIAELMAREPSKLAIGVQSSTPLSKLLKKKNERENILDTLQNY